MELFFVLGDDNKAHLFEKDDDDIALCDYQTKSKTLTMEYGCVCVCEKCLEAASELGLNKNKA